MGACYAIVSRWLSWGGGLAVVAARIVCLRAQSRDPVPSRIITPLRDALAATLLERKLSYC